MIQSSKTPTIAVVIPCYRVRAQILDVISHIGSEVSHIFAIDDCCPDGSGDHIIQHCTDPRVVVIRNEKNLGVGGTVLAGYKAAIAAGADIIVKVDGDGQMDPALIPILVAPIVRGEADYTKGNRFFDLNNIYSMPKIRVLGNAVLSLMNKLSSGYWNIFDPTNGFIAIHAKIAQKLPFNKISNRYFFESDMLFRLNLMHAVVLDIPMDAKYGNEKSSLRISEIIGEFLAKHTQNFLKRIFYNYFLRDLSLASIELVLGILLMLWGGLFGWHHWQDSAQAGVFTSAGTVMLSAMPIMLGLQFFLAFLAYDIASVPKYPLSRMLPSP